MSNEFAFIAIGGGAAGLSAIRGYRQAGGEGPVAIVTDEDTLPYQRPPLTKGFLRGDTEPGDLPLEEESWLLRAGVSLVAGRAVELDPGARRVTLSGGRELRYRACALTTGAEPRRLPIDGADHPRVHVLRSVAHARRLLAELTADAEVAVIGSGFIGCEIAASLRRRGNGVVMISDEPAPNQARLGAEAGAEIAGWLQAEGVRLRFGAGVEAIEPEAESLRVRAGGMVERVERAIMAAGVAPRVELFAASSPVDGDAIPVDASMRTELSDVFAAGDACKARNVSAGRSLRVEHWGDALTQGEIAGATAAGRDRQWSDVPGFWSQIGERTLKYAAWGDGYDTVARELRSDGGWVARYGADGLLVGVLTYNADDAYELGKQAIAQGAPWD